MDFWHSVLQSHDEFQAEPLWTHGVLKLKGKHDEDVTNFHFLCRCWCRAPFMRRELFKKFVFAAHPSTFHSSSMCACCLTRWSQLQNFQNCHLAKKECLCFVVHLSKKKRCWFKISIFSFLERITILKKLSRTFKDIWKNKRVLLPWPSSSRHLSSSKSEFWLTCSAHLLERFSQFLTMKTFKSQRGILSGKR